MTAIQMCEARMQEAIDFLRAQNDFIFGLREGLCTEADRPVTPEWMKGKREFPVYKGLAK